MKKNRLIFYIIGFIGIILLETFLHIVFSTLLYIGQYSWNSLFIVAENTGDSFFNRIIDSAVYILLLRLIFLELLMKFVINFLTRSKLLFIMLNLISISLFIFFVDGVYYGEVNYTEISHPIWSWRYQLLGVVVFVSTIRMINYKKINLTEVYKSDSERENEIIDQK